MGKKKFQKIAVERIYRLFELAEKTGSRELANRYVFLAKKIATCHNIRLPTKVRLKYCKKCGFFLKKPKIRIDKKGWIVTCNFCGFVKKTGFPQTNAGANTSKNSSGNKIAKIVPNKKKGANGGKSR